jgi:uncharacterized protein
METGTTSAATTKAPQLAKPRQLFVNVPVTSLERSVEFFTALGFTFNPQFTDESATCMLVGRDAYFMIMVRDRFASFTKRPVADPGTSTGALFAVSADSRAEVDEMVHAAVAAGGTRALDPVDHGFMYGWSFFDPDGHHWEVFWMDPAHVE